MKAKSNFLLYFLVIILGLLSFTYVLYTSWVDKPLKLFLQPVQDIINPSIPQVDWLSTHGKFIINQKNEPVILRGVNVSSINWGTDDWNSKAVTYAAKQWQSKIIRTRIFQEDFEKDEKLFFQKLEDQILRPARAEGVYVILHPWLHDNKAMPDEGTIKMWQTIADRYKNDPTIIYDLLAEPRDVKFDYMRDQYLKLIKAVREVHPRSLIMVSGLNWGRDINQWLEEPLPYDNIIYRSNPYNKSGEFEGLFGQIASTYPVFLGEFGAGGFPPMDEQSVTDLIAFADKLGLGWTAWNFSVQGCPCLLDNEQKFIPSSYGQIVKQALLRNSQPQEIEITKTGFDKIGKLYIYSDHLENGFMDYSWSSQIKLKNQENIWEGESSLGFSLDQYGALALQTTRVIDTSKYDNISLVVSKNCLDKLKLSLRYTDDNLSRELDFAQANRVKQDSNWQVLNFPLSQFKLNKNLVNGIIINSDQSPILNCSLDEIYFY